MNLIKLLTRFHEEVFSRKRSAIFQHNNLQNKLQNTFAINIRPIKYDE